MKPHAICRLDDVLVWPLTLDKGEVDDKEGGRIPFNALHFLMNTCNIDVSHADFTLSKRGKKFFFESSRRIASHIREQQQM